MIKDPTEKTEPGSDKAASSVRSRHPMGGSGRFSTWIRSIWRQRWLCLASAWTICVVGWTAVALWPSLYMSSAVVYADLHRLVGQDTENESQASGDLAKQGPVELLKTVLLTDQSLADIQSATNLGQASAKTLATDVMIRASAPTLFVASYDHSDPAIARRVLETLFSSLSDRIDKKASEEADALEQDIAELGEKLEIADAELSDFQQTNADFFPEASGRTTDITILEQERSDLQQRIEEAIVERDEVAEKLAKFPLAQEAESEPAAAEPLTEEQENELALLEAKLVELKERYANSHPYVVTTLEEIDALKGQADAEETPSADEVKNAVIPADDGEIGEQLADLKQLHEEKIAKLAQLNNNLASKEREIDRLRALTDTTSSVEAERSRLMAEKNDLETTLAKLVSRRDEAAITGGERTDQQGVTDQEGAGTEQKKANTAQKGTNAEQTSFRLIDGPSLPDKPTGLSRLMCLVLVLLGGIVVGGGIAVLRNRSKGVFESAWQLKQRFDVGVLGTISEVLSPDERRKLGYARLAFSLGCVGLMFIFSGLAIAELMNLLTPWGDSLRTRLLG